ncbi:MAG TPA: DNA methyltransferase [Verrucomicrobiae bacterium]|nr:DNA methyltransferase [Verrucomicrobiae bacterium]
MIAATPFEENLEFAFRLQDEVRPRAEASLSESLIAFKDFGKATQVIETVAALANGARMSVPTYVNEFWTARQRAANSLHEVSYRACFKPQLPRFFIQRLTTPGEMVHDPFMGRGTTILEAALLGRIPCGCDINPLSICLTRPRLEPPTIGEVEARLTAIDWSNADAGPEELLVFYHPETLREICALKKHLLRRKADMRLDAVDRWIEMVALNRLTGHSPGFFSVYTMPPNQAVTVHAQRKINARRAQKPPRRHVAVLIRKKTRQLLADCGANERAALAPAARSAILLTAPANTTPEIASGAVSLVVTSPPFLDVVNYASDNWLRCWFIGIEAAGVALTIPKKLEEWQSVMSAAFVELFRVLRPGGHVAFEVGEVRSGRIKLEEAVIPCGVKAGLEPVLVLINDQKFTKTANCWGVDNNDKGTNTNRVVVFRKP